MTIQGSAIARRQIAEKLNAQARELAAELLPNGHYNHNRTRWMFSGVADTGNSESAYVELEGPRQGKWVDFGNALPGKDRGDMLDLMHLKADISSLDTRQ